MSEFGEPSHFSTSANTRCLFVDTNLGTSLVLLVHHNDTIYDFKDIFCFAHKNCFPDFGYINVSSFKVKRREQFYELSDLMTMISIFGRTSGDWFMSADAVVQEVEDDPIVENTQETEAGNHEEEGAEGANAIN